MVFSMPTLGQRLSLGIWSPPGNMTFLPGLDRLGRDMVSRLIYRNRSFIRVGFSTVALAGVNGTMAGIHIGVAVPAIPLVANWLRSVTAPHPTR